MATKKKVKTAAKGPAPKKKAAAKKKVAHPAARAASKHSTPKSSKSSASKARSSSASKRPTSSAREKLTIIRPSGRFFVQRTGPRKKVTRPPEKSNVGPLANEPRVRSDDSFFDLVHEVARQIPRGRVTSYGAIGAALGTRNSARMVGWAMMASPTSKLPVPAHRVVNSVGLLTGRHHYNPPERMQQLLEKEGVKVKDSKVVDFKKLFWDPSQEL